VIHSHIHIDHIGGDTLLSDGGRIPVYGPAGELEESLIRHRELAGLGTGRGTNDPSTFLGSMEAIEDILTDFSGMDHIDVCGARFSFVESAGHSKEHRLIVTPDKVCYLGDAIMYGDTLAGSKAPYTYDLAGDVISKKKLAQLEYPKYIAAHEESFDREEMPAVIEQNLAIFRNILENVARLEEAEPSLAVIEGTKKLLTNIGIHGHMDIYWLSETIRQYFDYYSRYHTDRFIQPADI